MTIKINPYPFNKDFVFSLAIDDLHPENINNSEHLDFGSSTKINPLKIVGETIHQIPEIKFSLFTVPNWIDRSDIPSGLFFPLRKLWRKRRRYKEGKFDISKKEYSSWIREVNSFYPENIEIAQHGLFHHNSNTHFPRSQEFAGLSKREAEKRIAAAEELFKKSKLKFSKGFRPPGWFITKEIVQVLKQKGSIYVAGNSDMKSEVGFDAIAKGAGLLNQFLFKETNNDGIINFTANCYPHQTQRAVEIARQKGILVIHCHIAETEMGLVSVTKNFPKQIKRIVEEISYQTGFKPWFATLEELSKFIHAREKLKYKVKKGKIIFINNSDHDLNGLTFVLANKTYIIDNIKSHSPYTFNLFGKNEYKKVSMILTVYNGEDTVKDSLNSLANQSYINTEIIVVNDGSTDRTKTIVERYIKETDDRRIKLINQENKGRAAAKNIGLKNATGELIAFCEDDAIYSRDYISAAIVHLEDKKIIGVIGPHFVWNRNESITTKVKDLERRRNFLRYKPSSAWVYRAEDLRKIGGFNENLEFGEDVEPGMKLKKLFPQKQFAFEPQSIWLHREPAEFFQYLKRKFKGGVGMAMLDKKNIRNFPKRLKQIFVLLPFLGILFLALVISIRIKTHGSFIPVLGALTFAFLLYARKADIKKSSEVSGENILTICLYILVEYIWWTATLLGIYAGFFLSSSYIKRLLRGR